MSEERDMLPSWDQIEGAVWQAAGAGAGAVMEEAPKVVMPTEKILEACTAIMLELRDSASVSGEILGKRNTGTGL